MLAHGFRTADAVVAGNWSRIAYEQMSRLTIRKSVWRRMTATVRYLDLPPVETWDVAPDSAFVHLPSMKRSTGCNTVKCRAFRRHAAAGVRYVQRDFVARV